MIKVSIIVPVYDVEKYLRRCLDSLINQTLQDIEIIVINDASPDHSDVIMREYMSLYPQKIKCIFLEDNRCQGGARNVGIEQAKGEFLMFVDADDYVDFTICEKLYNAALRGQYDTVYCDYYREEENTGRKNWSNFIYDGLCGEITLPKRLCLLVGYYFCVGQIIHSSFFSDGGLRFPEKMKFEDAVFVAKHMLKTQKSSKVSEPLYTYVLRDDSTSHIKNPAVYYDYKKAAGLMLACRKESSSLMDFTLIKYAAAQMYLSCLKRLLEFDTFTKEEASGICEEIIKQIPDIFTFPLLYTSTNPALINMIKSYKSEDGNFSKWLEISRKDREGHKYYYQYFGNEIASILLELKRKYKKIVFWGAGKKGKEFLSQFDSDHQIFTCVVDKNPESWGTVLSTNHTIMDFRKIALDTELIIIANRNFLSSVTDSAKSVNKTVKIIDIDTTIALQCSKGIVAQLEGRA